MNTVVALSCDGCHELLARKFTTRHQALESLINLIELHQHLHSGGVARLQVGKGPQGSTLRNFKLAQLIIDHDALPHRSTAGITSYAHFIIDAISLHPVSELVHRQSSHEAIGQITGVS